MLVSNLGAADLLLSLPTASSSVESKWVERNGAVLRELPGWWAQTVGLGPLFGEAGGWVRLGSGPSSGSSLVEAGPRVPSGPPPPSTVSRRTHGLSGSGYRSTWPSTCARPGAGQGPPNKPETWENCCRPGVLEPGLVLPKAPALHIPRSSPSIW